MKGVGVFFEKIIFDYELDTQMNDNLYNLSLNIGSTSKQEAKEAINNIENNIIQKCENRDVLLPISGGLDSRFILSSVLKSNYKSLRCFTFGSYGSFEVDIARQIAIKLKLDWQYIELKSKDYITCGIEVLNKSNGILSPMHMHLYKCIKKINPSKGALLLHGYLGDPAAGDSYLSKCTDDDEVTYLLNMYIGWRDLSFIDHSAIHHIKEKLNIIYNKYLENNEKGYFCEWFKGTQRQLNLIQHIPEILKNFTEVYTPYNDDKFISRFYSLTVKDRKNRKLFLELTNEKVDVSIKGMVSTAYPFKYDILNRNKNKIFRIYSTIQYAMDYISGGKIMVFSKFIYEQQAYLLNRKLDNEVKMATEYFCKNYNIKKSQVKKTKIYRTDVLLHFVLLGNWLGREK
jgi:asparagine synthetase B (glutamine-hydrolysing)